jgi:hypothetical protein
MAVRADFHVLTTINRSVELNRMMANLEKAITSQDTTHGGLADRTSIDSIEMRLPTDDDDMSLTVGVVAKILYHKQTGDPFAQP